MLLAGGLVGSTPGDAAVVVLDNQAAGKVDFAIRQPDGRETRHTLVPGELTPIAVTSPVGIIFDAQGQLRRYLLQANNIYCFVGRDQKLDLSELELPGPDGARSSDLPNYTAARWRIARSFRTRYIQFR